MTKQDRKPKKQKGLMKKNIFKFNSLMLFFSSNKSKATRQRNKETKTRKQNKTKKQGRKKERDRERERETEKERLKKGEEKLGRNNGRH